MSGGARKNLVLAGVLVALIGTAFALQPDRQRPNREFLPDMAHQVRFNAYAANPYFPDGKTLRPPVPGTIPRGVKPLRFGTSPEEAARAGTELSNPFPATSKEALARGKVLYRRLCVPCHGDKGMGDGPVALRGFPPPASLRSDKARQLKDGEIFHILTYGKGNMPPYAAQMTREDRWRVILFLRSLQQQAVAAAR